MKAIVLNAFGGVDQFREADLPLPEIRRGEVRVRVRAASFNPVDYQIRKGQPEAKLLTSMILGRDLAGTVDAVHASVADFREGDEVYSYVAKLASSGTYAEYVSVPAELVAKKPATLTHAEAAAVPVAGITASLALSKVGAAPGSSLFVAGGAGGVGTFAIGLAQCLGVRKLMCSAGNPPSRAYLIARCGLQEIQVVDYRDEDFGARALEGNGGAFDGVVDLVGGGMLSACCALLARDGNLASVVDAPTKDDFEILFEKNASFHAVGAHAYSLSVDRGIWRTYRELLDRLSQRFDSGELAPPAITVMGALSVQTVRDAHTRMEGGGVQGKLVMTC